MKNSHLELVLGGQKFNLIKKSNIFIVGVGGIGCQFIKNMSKCGFKKFTILDLDHIQSTNLNRQFYFRQNHVGMSKADVGKQSLLKIDSSLEITSINGNIYDKQFDCKFFSQFDVFVSALDNMKAREHLARLAVQNNKPLVDAGTSAYNGQAKPNIRFITDCHNCNPSKAEQTYAACTIRSRPQRPIHCAVFAKAFYDSFFGSQGTHSLKGSLNYQNYVTKSLKQYSDQDLCKIGIQIYEELFSRTITEIDDDGNKIPLVRKIPYETALKSQQEVQNSTFSTYKEAQYQAQQNSQFQQQKLWSLKKYAQKFIQSMKNLIIKKENHQAPQKFQKDDNDCATLISCIMNLRTANFINMSSTKNKHKFLTFYQCKDLAGKIHPAIASTNSIAAALEMRQLINILNKDYNKMRYITIKNYSYEKLNPLIMTGPNLDCIVCSRKVIYASVQCNFQETVFGQFEQFAKQNFFTYGRCCSSRQFNVASDSKKQRKISMMKDVTSKNNIIEIYYIADPQISPLFININIIHNQKMRNNQFKIVNTPNKKQLRKQIIDYHRKKHQNNSESKLYDIQDYGYM